MTVIAGVEVPGKGVAIGADSATTSGERVVGRAEPKIFRQGRLIIAHAGSPRVAQILEHFYKFHAPRKDQQPEAWMVRKFIPTVIHLLQQHGALKTEEGAIRSDQMYLLVGVHDHLFGVWNDFQTERTDCGFHAMGSGSELARGALFATDDKPPETRVREALAAAAQFSTSCGLPFHYMENFR